MPAPLMRIQLPSTARTNAAATAASENARNILWRVPAFAVSHNDIRGFGFRRPGRVPSHVTLKSDNRCGA
jgi:hypothetical protein